MVYGSAFNGPGFYPPMYGGGGYFPNYAPNLYPTTFFPPGPIQGGPTGYRPYVGYFPDTYPKSHHFPTESTDWNQSAKDYFGELGDAFTKW